MMKVFLIALSISAVLAQDMSVDSLLEESVDMDLPCIPKPCVPVCKPVTKYISFGSFKISYTENVCKPDEKCLAAHAACLKTLEAAMKDAAVKAAALAAASKAKNSAGANKAAKDKAAAARKAEAVAAKSVLDAAKQAAVAAEKEAATARSAHAKLVASTAAAKKESDEKTRIMDVRVAAYEKAKEAHLNAVAAYEGAKSAAAQAAQKYAAAVKAHCDAEAQHAKAVKTIGHGHMAKNTCSKWSSRKSGSPALSVFTKSSDGYWMKGSNHLNNICNKRYDHVGKEACAKKCLDFGDNCLGFEVYQPTTTCYHWTKSSEAELKAMGCTWHANTACHGYTRKPASSGLPAGKYAVSYTNGFKTTYTISSDGKVSGSGLPNGGARKLTPSTSSKCPGQPCFFLTGVHSAGKDEYITKRSDGKLTIEHYNPNHCCTGTGVLISGSAGAGPVEVHSGRCAGAHKWFGGATKADCVKKTLAWSQCMIQDGGAFAYMNWQESMGGKCSCCTYKISNPASISYHDAEYYKMFKVSGSSTPSAAYKLVKKNTVCGADTTLVHSGQAISVSQCAKMAADNKGDKCPADPDGQYFMYNPSYRGKPFCGCTRKGHRCGPHAWGGIDLYKNP